MNPITPYYNHPEHQQHQNHQNYQNYHNYQQHHKRNPQAGNRRIVDQNLEQVR